MTEHDKQALYRENLRLKDEMKRQQHHIHYLENELSEIRSLKSHIKKLVRKKARSMDSKVESFLKQQKTFQPVVPSKQGDILANVRQADRQNLARYNRLFSKSLKIRAYKKAKRVTKRIVGRGKGKAQ